MTNLKTPTRKKSKAVDLITGKDKVQYFFDPALLLPNQTPKTPKRSDSSFDASLSHKHLYVPCTIVKKDESHTLVKTTDGSLYKLISDDLISLSTEDRLGVDDVLHLPNISEATLVHTLRVRYERDEIYTNAGPILISINPYKTILKDKSSIYSEANMMAYQKQKAQSGTAAPHLFAIADRAFNALTTKDKSQSIIISGESGAGKTEATKIIMQYLAKMSHKKDMEDCSQLENQVLASNPLLESFGNARTLKNDNSSRFGKFIQIKFSQGQISGASITNYLLEKTRIVHQIDGERNYHIFYQILSDEALSKELKLEDPDAIQYLCKRYVKSKRDEKAFEETKQCLDNIGLNEEDQKVIFQIAAGVLHLGNVNFTVSGENDVASISSDESKQSLSIACELLGWDEKDVSEAILTKVLTVGKRTITKEQNISQAIEKRDVLAKMVYSSLFLWLVSRINETIHHAHLPVDLMSPSSTHDSFDFENIEEMKSIGVLDIYGFEQFDVNGFEQLLINYANEKLQRHFNRHLFEVEQELYANEGVDWTYITFNDNRPCLELIEGGGGSVGILGILDDAWGGMGTGSEKDIKFVSQLHQSFGGVQETSTSVMKKKKSGDVSDGSHQNYKMPKFANDKDFIVIHYAGEVRYTAYGFSEKNGVRVNESLSNELMSLGKSSSSSLAKQIFSHCQDESTPCEEQSGSRSRSTIRGASVASQFKTSLQTLVTGLESTEPHYIRCVKPNLKKASECFETGEVLRQLRYAGMMEAIRIRREGYAHRESHESFINKYHILLDSEDLKDGEGIEHLVKVLSKRLSVTDIDWQVGHSKIFFRRELAVKLEALASIRIRRAARTVGRFGRIVAHTRAGKLLSAWGRWRLIMIQKHREINAATKIQSAFRMTRDVRSFKSTKSAVIKMQSVIRMISGKILLDQLKHPYKDMTFEEVEELYNAEKECLEYAVADKDYELAAELEKKIDPLKEALEDKRPLTRALIDKMIKEVEEELEVAVANKDYASCPPLQAKLEDLNKKKEDYPTLEELKQKVVDAQKAVDDAAAKRNFKDAAALQAAVDSAQKRLQKALSLESKSVEDVQELEQESNEDESSKLFSSRSELEEAIKTKKNQVDEAIKQKNFKDASSIQDELDQLESLRPDYPTIAELEAALKSKEEEMAALIAKKKFADAGALQDEIDSLSEKIKAETALEKETSTESNQESENVSVEVNGSMLIFSSRSDLQSTIQEYKNKVETAAATKNFVEATANQEIVTKLESLRQYLPTLDDLLRKEKELEKEMNQALKSKDFALAESLDKELSKLKEKLKNEKETHQTLFSSQTPSSPTEKKEDEIKTAYSIKTSIAKVQTPSTQKITTNSNTNAPTAKKRQKHIERPVSKLRPKKPLISSISDSVLSVAQMLANKRGSASLVIGVDGGLAGIITDTDVTRRLVAKDLDAGVTNVSKVMTANPTVVSVNDPAMDALSTMVENHFRHLPVVDDNGAVVGVLDIAKCLNDAISKLEKAEEQNSSAAADAVKQMAAMQGAGGQQAAMLTQLLGPLMSQAFGGKASPTLRSLLAGKPATIVSPSASLKKTSIAMAEAKKAALVVDRGELVGIFGFKDMMSRAVAKELLLEHTTVESVMTPNPESVSPDMTVIEALQVMHDNKFLNLPVCESDGRVCGLVGVMDLIYGCGGAEGWRSLFDRTMSMGGDDGSETASHYSHGSRSVRTNRTSSKSKASVAAVNERPVSKLRPKKPLISSISDSVLSVAQMLANKRGSASLVIGVDGGLAGIITDTDVTRRLVAKDLDAGVTNVSKVMTANPTVVSVNDPAMDALSTMVENHFRHLPVVDDNGAVVGVLDIAKCLNDAISKLEKAEEQNSSAAADAVKQMAAMQGAGGQQAAMLTQLLGPLMSQAFGGKASPTLRSLLAGKPATIVSPSASLKKTSIAMAEAKKAALVVDRGELVGIFGFKDMMSRAVAKELLLEHTTVESVMTPNPESVSPDMTVIEALQVMHDNKFLNLPVCESDGRVCGLVGVMDLIYGCGGAEGWRSLFDRTMSMGGDDGSETASHYSHGSRSVRTNRTSSKSKASVAAVNERPVSKLRPKKPLISSISDSVLSVAQMLANKRGSASLVIGVDGGLAGIITDTDVTRRLVAKDLDAGVTNVSKVMTANPTVVSVNDPAMDALSTMVENHFRHLPVVDDNGAVVGVLDIAKCLNDAISKLEKAEEQNSSAAADAVKQMAAMQGAGGQQAAMLTQLLGPLMSQAFGGKASPTLRSLLAGKPATIVSPSASLKKTSIAMAEAKKAALVVDRGELVGIFGFKDMMSRAVAKELLLEHTTVESVMTPNPESVSPDMTVIEALQVMHDNKFLNLPVCESDGRVCGLVGVMDLIYGCGGAEGWRSLFDRTMSMGGDDGSETASHYSHGSRSVRTNRTSSKSKASVAAVNERPVSKLRPKKPLISSISDSVLSVAQMLANKRGSASLVIGVDGGLAGIITDTDVTRRLVAKDLDAGVTNVSKVMTANPTVVSVNDPAMDALSTMVENHFRHLPVVDDNGAVVGVLDIAKCLNDAISKLEKAEEQNSSAAADAVKQMAALQGAGGQQAAMLTQLLGPLMSHAFGGKASPTLRSLLAGKPATIVSPSASLKKTSIAMAEAKKAALVVDRGELVGIFGFKDMMSRAVAKELLLEHTAVESVMTPNPESVSPDMTVIEALQVMHDNKFLNLPVCESDGRVCGLVGVMDLIYGCGGAEGWRSLFDRTMSMGSDDGSETASHVSSVRSSSVKSVRTSKSSKTKKNLNPVSKLRPRKALILSESCSVTEICQHLAAKRSASVLLTDKIGKLSGIITDHDIVRRVVSRHKNASDTVVSAVMTKDPTTVSSDDFADEALHTMIENHYRYLPVIDNGATISGILDIGKCLNDAITKLEKSVQNKSSSNSQLDKLMASAGGDQNQAKILAQLLGPIMEQAFKSQDSKTLGDLLAGKPSSGFSVTPSSSLVVTGMMMADNHKAALVVEDGELVGIVSFKDLVTRALAKDLDLESTEVHTIMTPDPEYVTPDTSVIEAMQIMHDNNFLTLPVCEENGSVRGVVDIMDLIYGAGGSDGWRSIFDSALDMDDMSDDRSIQSGASTNYNRDKLMPLQSDCDEPVIRVNSNSQYASAVLNNVPNHVEFKEGDQISLGDSLLDRTMMSFSVHSPDKMRNPNDISFKVIDSQGHKYLVRSDGIYSNLLRDIVKKIDYVENESSIRLKFVDDEGDQINISSDDCLAEAIATARQNGDQGVKLMLTIMKEEKSSGLNAKTLALAGGGAAVALGIAVMTLLKPKGS